jgi:tripartite-type tricarboxylate transporter receptor subunit TctC
MLSRRFALTAAFAAGAAAAARAQDFPSRPLRLVVPYSPGGVGDTFARVLGEKLTARLGQQVLIDNKPGASQVLGAQSALSAPADGHTLFLGSVSSLAINVSTQKALPYDPLKSFVPLSLGFTGPLYLIVNNDVRAKDAGELIAYGKANPGKLGFASIGPGSSLHLAGELFKTMAGIDMLHVPYKGSAPALVDLMADRVQIIFDAGTTSIAQARAGRVKVLGSSSLKRFAGTPDIPPIAETGLPGYEMDIWFGLVTHAGTPEAAVARLSQEINAVLVEPALVARFLELGVQLQPSTPQEFGALIAREIPKWRKVVLEDAKLTPE